MSKVKAKAKVKKVLGVVGSPRKNGNTHVLVDRILEGAQERGAGTEILFLNDLDIRECDGCHACWKGQQCPKHDDMNGIYAKIIESDAIVLGTPIYWYGPTALMKAFIDRLVFFNCPENRPKIRGKSAVVAIPYEEEDPATGAAVAAFFEKCLRYLEMNLVGKIVVPGVTEKGDVLKKKQCLDQAFEIGRRLV